MARDCLTDKHNFHTTCLGLIVGTPSTLIPETSTHLKVTYLGEGEGLNTPPHSVKKLTLTETAPEALTELSLSHQQRAVMIAAADPILAPGPRQQNASSEGTEEQHYTVTFSSLNPPNTLGTLTQAHQDSWRRGWREFQA